MIKRTIVMVTVGLLTVGCGISTKKNTLSAKILENQCDPGPCKPPDTRCWEVCLGGRNLFIGDNFCEAKELFIRGAVCGPCENVLPKCGRNRVDYVPLVVEDDNRCFDGPCDLVRGW